MTEPHPTRPAHVLVVVVLAQFLGTSVWFASNAVIDALPATAGVDGAVAWVTGAVQLGFILGSAGLSASGLADRMPSRWLFAICALAAGLTNALALWAPGLWTLCLARFATGVALAGVYPIGMRLAASWYAEGLGRALGWLVGALVLGTALPHLIAGLGQSLSASRVIGTTSLLAVLGGALVAVALEDGPHARRGGGFDPGALRTLWRIPAFRASALGYFGHMWELYAFWALLPAWIGAFVAPRASLASFAVIAAGAIGCTVGGLLAARISSGRVAFGMLAVSGICCLVAPFLTGAPRAVQLVFLLVWGVAVAGDSPQFSALTALAAPKRLVGTGLAFATAVGFGLTVVSLQVVSWVPLAWASWVLVPGPVLGLVALGRTR